MDLGVLGEGGGLCESYLRQTYLRLIWRCQCYSLIGGYMWYRKSSKNWDTWNNYHNCPTIGTVGFYSAVLCSKDADRITNREDPDQTAP